MCARARCLRAAASARSGPSSGSSPLNSPKLEIQLKAEVQELLALAESTDQADVPYGIDLPAEIRRREDRLAAMAEAKARIAGLAGERNTPPDDGASSEDESRKSALCAAQANGRTAPGKPKIRPKNRQNDPAVQLITVRPTQVRRAATVLPVRQPPTRNARSSAAASARRCSR